MKLLLVPSWPSSWPRGCCSHSLSLILVVLVLALMTRNTILTHPCEQIFDQRSNSKSSGPWSENTVSHWFWWTAQNVCLSQFKTAVTANYQLVFSPFLTNTKLPDYAFFRAGSSLWTPVDLVWLVFFMILFFLVILVCNWSQTNHTYIIRTILLSI